MSEEQHLPSTVKGESERIQAYLPLYISVITLVAYLAQAAYLCVDRPALFTVLSFIDGTINSSIKQ